MGRKGGGGDFLALPSRGTRSDSSLFTAEVRNRNYPQKYLRQYLTRLSTNRPSGANCHLTMPRVYPRASQITSVHPKCECIYSKTPCNCPILRNFSCSKEFLSITSSDWTIRLCPLFSVTRNGRWSRPLSRESQTFGHDSISRRFFSRGANRLLRISILIQRTLQPVCREIKITGYSEKSVLSKCYSLVLLELKSNTGDNNVALGAKRNHPKFVKDRRISSLSLKAPSLYWEAKRTRSFPL